MKKLNLAKKKKKKKKKALIIATMYGYMDY